MNTFVSRRDQLKNWDQSLLQLKAQLTMLRKSDRMRNSYKWEHISEDIASLANKERTLSVKIQNLFQLVNDSSLNEGKQKNKLAKMLTANLELCLKSNFAHRDFILKKCWQKVAKIQINHLLRDKKVDPNKHPKEALAQLKIKQHSLYCEYQKLNHKKSYDAALSDLRHVEHENQRAVNRDKVFDFQGKSRFAHGSQISQLKKLLEINNIDTKTDSDTISGFHQTFLTYQKDSKKILGGYRELCQKILNNRTDRPLRSELIALSDSIEELRRMEKDLDSATQKLLQPKVRSAQILVKKQESDAFTV